MSPWTHPSCEPCWVRRHGFGAPVRLANPQPEVCCFCGVETEAGIYVRADPAGLRCGGKHEAPA